MTKEVFDNIITVATSPNWQYAVWVEKDWEQMIIKNWEEEIKWYKDFEDINFVWETFVFVAQKLSWKRVLVIDWKESEEYDWIDMRLLENNKKFICKVIKNWKEFLIIDWNEVSKGYDFIDMKIEEDYYGVVCAEWKERTLFINWEEIYKTDEALIWDFEYDPDSKSYAVILEKWYTDNKEDRRYILIKDEERIGEHYYIDVIMYTQDKFIYTYREGFCENEKYGFKVLNLN